MNGLREIETKNSLWEKALRYLGVQRENERVSAIRANTRDYNLSPESQAALDRGDRQRATGVSEDSYLEGVRDEDSLTEAECWEDPGYDTLEEKELDDKERWADIGGWNLCDKKGS